LFSSADIYCPPFSPAFPNGLSLDTCIVDPIEAQHMGKMHYSS